MQEKNAVIRLEKQESETATTSGVTKSALLYEKERITDELNNIQRPTKEEASQQHGEGGNIRLESRNTFMDVNAPRCKPQGTFQKDALDFEDPRTEETTTAKERNGSRSNESNTMTSG